MWMAYLHAMGLMELDHEQVAHYQELMDNQPIYVPFAVPQSVLRKRGIRDLPRFPAFGNLRCVGPFSTISLLKTPLEGGAPVPRTRSYVQSPTHYRLNPIMRKAIEAHNKIATAAGRHDILVLTTCLQPLHLSCRFNPRPRTRRLTSSERPGIGNSRQNRLLSTSRSPVRVPPSWIS